MHTKESLGKEPNKDSLVAIAVDEFETELYSDDFTRDTLENKILDLQDEFGNAEQSNDTPEVDADAELDIADDVTDDTSDSEAGEQMYTLVINSTEGPGGNAPFTPCINGKAWSIKRDVEVVVPERVIEVLRNSVTTVFSRHDRTGEIVERNVKRFNYQFEKIVS